MNTTERQHLILERLQNGGHLDEEELAKLFDVSTRTIRKDLKKLEELGLFHFPQMGYNSTLSNFNDTPFLGNEIVNIEEKQKIAQRAIHFLNEDDAIILGAGTTILAFAQAIPKNFQLTVLSAAMDISMELISKPKIEIVQLGGLVRRRNASVLGPHAVEMMRHFACNKLFLSADGISLEYGLSTSNLMEAHLSSRMIRSVQKTIILADSSKFNKRSFGKICELVEDIDQIITDQKLSTHIFHQLEDKGIEVTLV
ncbi:DeoR/GlpR family DNA-binding transcription regulator [Echinicola jeungdonensis]|uniref:DeoR/GlpR family DNA-binding transcription regulator n=2 Tax=Echinicola jeungdonensis TaxID=709343 RepID=A0ABV5J6Z7_9BACT